MELSVTGMRGMTLEELSKLMFGRRKVFYGLIPASEIEYVTCRDERTEDIKKMIVDGRIIPIHASYDKYTRKYGLNDGNHRCTVLIEDYNCLYIPVLLSHKYHGKREDILEKEYDLSKPIKFKIKNL